MNVPEVPGGTGTSGSGQGSGRSGGERGWKWVLIIVIAAIIALSAGSIIIKELPLHSRSATQALQQYFFASDSKAIQQAQQQNMINAPIRVFADRPTVIEVWDCGAEDGDIISLNGLTINLKHAHTVLQVPPGITSIELVGINEGWSPPATAAVRSEAGGTTSFLVVKNGERISIKLVH